MVVERGEIWWADLGEPDGSEPGYRRPVLIVQNDSFNRSNLATVLIVPLTSNLSYRDFPGNVLIPAKMSGLPNDSVANVSQILTVDRRFLEGHLGKVRGQRMKAVEEGLRLVLAL